MQVSLVDSKRSLDWVVGTHGQSGSTQLLKYQLMARNIICPGALPFVANLLTSLSSAELGKHAPAVGSAGKGSTGGAQPETRRTRGSTMVGGPGSGPGMQRWLSEYIHGASFQVTRRQNERC